jgi:hypothetical protein
MLPPVSVAEVLPPVPSIGSALVDPLQPWTTKKATSKPTETNK